MGSLAVVERLLAPAVAAVAQKAATTTATGSAASAYFVVVCHALWLWPTYVVSAVMNTLWYGDIAKTTWALAVGDRQKEEKVDDAREWFRSISIFRARRNGNEGDENVSGAAKKNKKSHDSHRGGGGVFKDVAAEVYRVILVSVFFAQISAVTIIFPGGVGGAMRATLETWLYAYYCFDYRWGMENRDLKWRLNHFEVGKCTLSQL